MVFGDYTKGEKVHRNADAENLAVLVEREGDDVVERASEPPKKESDPATPPRPSSEAGEGEQGDKKEVEVGEKRERAESADPPAKEQPVEAEKEAGKEIKKPKLAEDVADGSQENVNSNGAGHEARSSSAPKKRGPGRPKKSDREAKKRDEEAKLEAVETISGRTRSKAS
jgi:hypothetical protein